MEIFSGQLDCEACYELNDVPAEALEQANALLRELLGKPEAEGFEQMMRIAAAAVYKTKPLDKGDGIVCATLTPFVFASETSGLELERAMVAIVQHQPFDLDSAEIKHILENPLRFPIGFFVCREALVAEDGSATRNELVPYCASACQLGVCLHLPPAVKAALGHKQAQHSLLERGRLLVGAQVVWRPLRSDRDLDDKTRSWIVDHPDCLVVTHIADRVTSYLIAEPFVN